MSDILRKKLTAVDFQENRKVNKGGKFKNGVSLQIRINNGNNSTANGNMQVSPSESFLALEELLQCGICLDRLSHPRMLPCQHTFCLNCLKTNVIAKNLKFSKGSSKNQKLTVAKEITSMTCPMCQRVLPIDQGLDSLEGLPKNLYLQSLLKVVEGSPSSPAPRENYRCVSCQMVSAQQEQVCQHCMQIFCSICWNQHLADLESNMSLIVKQLTESEEKLKHKLDNFESRCDALAEKVKKATKMKVEEILGQEKLVLDEIVSIKKEGGVAADILTDSIFKLKEDIRLKSLDRNNNQKVVTYINLHKETSKMLDNVNYFGEARLTFDPDTFKLDQISEGIYNDEDDHHQNTISEIDTDPFESSDSMARHYKSRSFAPKLVWKKCPRPAGLAIPPWDDTKLYIAATDSQSVLIVDRSKFKLVDRLSTSEMLCPVSIAFSNTRKEVFVSDKWKQCIHVFSCDGEYLRNICAQRLRSPDGIAMDANDRLIICDCGNDRVLLVDPESGEKLQVIGAQKGYTELNFPSSVAVYGTKIVVADSGNHRVKIYDSKGSLLQEIGSFGRNPGQFISAEVVTVDQLGFVLVGDAGNARIQVFKPDGTLVKIFGSKGGFGWVSGILVTPNMDIIASDSKSRSLRIF